jgi:hypothetical protein
MTWLSYDASLARVMISTSGIRALIGSDDTVQIQRSVTGVTWSTVRGASAVMVTSSSAPVSDYEFAPDVVNQYRAVATAATYTGSITPALGGTPWIKNLRYPFLNLAVKLSDAGDIARPANGTTFTPVGRSYAVAVPVTRSGRQYAITVETDSDTATQALDALLGTGDTLFLQVPAGYAVPVLGGYYLCGDTTETRNGVPWALRWTTLNLTEVVPPGADVTPLTSTWTTVTSDYPTWAAVPAALTTWADVVELVGAPGDIIVS